MTVQAAAPDTYKIHVNRTQNYLIIYKKTENGGYTPFKAMVCSVGRNNYTPTGSFNLKERYRWHELNGKVYGQYCTRITGHILFHSVYYSVRENPATLSYNAYNQLGSAASQGCIRLCVADAKWIYENCPMGTSVEIYDSDKKEPLKKPQAIKIDSKSPYRYWDPTDPDPENPWVFKKPVMEGAVNRIIERGSDKTALIKDVKVTDFAGWSVPITVEGKVKLNVCGKYKVTYVATDVLGQTIKKAVTLTVKDTKKPSLTRDKKTFTISEEANKFKTREDMTAYFRKYLHVTDNDVELGKKYITVKDSELWKAWTTHKSGTYEVKVYAKDKAGNKTIVKTLKVKYVAPKVEKPPVEENTDENTAVENTPEENVTDS